MTIPTPLLVMAAVAGLASVVVVALHFLNRRRWDAETARLRARGLPWIVLLILTLTVVFVIGSLVGAKLGHSSGVAGLLVILLVAVWSRRASAAKKLER